MGWTWLEDRARAVETIESFLPCKQNYPIQNSKLNTQSSQKKEIN
jgi:hypothetical protein